MKTIRSFTPTDEQEVIRLWKRCGLLRPWNDPRKDIRCKQSVQPDLFLVLEHDERIAGTVMAGFDGHRGWLNYLGVEPELQSRGFGRLLVEEATLRLRRLGCPKINIQVRSDNQTAIAFYKRLGFGQDDVLSLGKRLDTEQP